MRQQLNWLCFLWLMKKLIDVNSIIVDAKSGLTGAGKVLLESSHFVNVHDNYVTYKLNRHQHIPEIVQELKRFDNNLEHCPLTARLARIA